MKVPTVEEYIKDYPYFNAMLTAQEYVAVSDHMVEFAKLHVQAALKAAHSNSQLPEEDLDFTLSSYPLENIK